jgi:hypothetical protein
MTPLFKKLNFKNQEKIFSINSPDSFADELNAMQLEADIVNSIVPESKVEFVICFVKTQAEVDSFIKKNNAMLVGDVVLWLCYPKMSSKKYACEFNRDTGWYELGKYDFEPVRAVAIDEDWSALRFRRVQYIKTLTRNAAYALTQEAKDRTTGK